MGSLQYARRAYREGNIDRLTYKKYLTKYTGDIVVMIVWIACALMGFWLNPYP